MAEITLCLKIAHCLLPFPGHLTHFISAGLINENQDKLKHEEEKKGNLDEIEDMVEDEDTACQLCIQVGQPALG